MQVQPDYLSVPRRALDVEDYIDILRRHWMWIIGPAFAGMVIGVVVAFLWPDTFISNAIMRITPAQVSDRLVPTNYNVDLRERLQTMHQDVTSRGKLIDMIKKFNLYPDEQEKRPLEDIVEDMRRKIKIQPIAMGDQRGGSAFRVEFAYHNRQDAQKVVNEIVSAFTSQNVIDRRAKSRITSEFLSEELKQAKEELDRIEGELTGFKMRNSGALPEEFGANLQLQRSMETQLQGVQDMLNRNQQDKMILETTVQNLKNQLDSLETTNLASDPAGQSDRLTVLEREIAAQEARVSQMRLVYRSSHPDLVAGESRLQSLKDERDALARVEDREKASKSPRRIVNPAALARKTDLEGQIKSTQARIHALELDMKERVSTQRKIEGELSRLNSRILSNPLRQGEYAKLVRDYNLSKQRYDDLNLKKANSEVANRLEDRSAGENLEVLDPASLPLKPSEPNRLLIVGAGVAIGVILGLFLAGAREIKDTTMKGLKDVRAYSNLNVLSSIPLLENALLVRRKRRLTWLAWSSAMIVGVVAMSGSVYYYYWGK
jgi:polysaccharide chain length determinant protein (PEP-CTERM system associated)